MARLTGEFKDLVNVVATSCRILGGLDVTHGALGHVSYRPEGSDVILIKGKGADEVGLRYTTPDDILLVDFEAEKVEGPSGLQPPSEAFLHLGLYQRNPELRSVIHMHPEHAVLLTICEKEIIPILGAYGPSARLAIDGVPVYPKSLTVANPDAGREFAEFMGRRMVALMKGHGVTVVGSSVEDATVRMIELDQLTSMLYKAYALGNPATISDEDIAHLRQPPEEHRCRGSVGGSAGVLASWRYYRSLSGA